jgi:hypothetical protein
VLLVVNRGDSLSIGLNFAILLRLLTFDSTLVIEFGVILIWHSIEIMI